MKKIIKALKHCIVGTRVERVELGEGEVAEIEFCSEAEFKGHLAAGMFVEWYKLSSTPIPVILPEDDSPAVEILTFDTTELGTQEEDVDDDDFDTEPDDNNKVTEFDKDILETANAAGRPYKCLAQGCDRLRKKEKMFCRVCEEQTSNEDNG